MGNQNKTNVFNLCQSNDSVFNDGNFINVKKFLSKFNNSSQFKSSLNEIKNKFIKSLKNSGLFKEEAFQTIFSTIDGYYLNSNEKTQFISMIQQLIQQNFRQKNNNQFLFCGQIAQKLHNFQNRLYFKHKHCLQYCKFQQQVQFEQNRYYESHFSEFQFDMDYQEVNDVSNIVRGFCQNNLDAFAFITLYLTHSVNNSLKTNNSLENVEKELLQNLKYLERIYPASEVFYEGKNDENFGIVDVKIGKYENIKFQPNGKKHIEQLKQFVIDKAQKARSDENSFIELVKNVCLEKGYGFKYGTKIRNKDHTPAIMRTIQKLLDKSKYDKDFEDLKRKCLNSQKIIQKKHQNRLRNYFQWQKQQVETKIKQILQKQSQIQFDSKDLLRGKCIFNKKQDIADAVKLITKRISQKGYTLYELKNRLYKNTKDITLIIKLQNSIAQLQLALKLDTVLNEFNHKIYELMRSKMYTPISNLCLLNQRWSSIFFSQTYKLIQFAGNQCKNKDFEQKQTFGQIINKIKPFYNKYIKTDFLSIQINTNDQNQMLKLKPQLKNIQQIMDNGYNKNIDNKKRQNEQLQNEINFYIHFKKYQQADSLLKKWQLKNQQNDIMMYLGGQINNKLGKNQQALKYFLKCLQLRQLKYNSNSNQIVSTLNQIAISYDNLGIYDEALINYKKAKSIIQINQSPQDDQMINFIENGLGLVYFHQGDYDKAIQYYQKCLNDSQNKFGKQSFQNFSYLTNLAAVYRNKGDLNKALQINQKSLKIIEKYSGKQSSDYSIVLNNLGLVYQNQNQFHKAISCYKKGLQIQQRIYGKTSLHCGTSFNNLGLVYLCSGNLNQAKTLFQKSFSVYEKIQGKQSQNCAMALVNIGQVARQLKDYPKALQSYEKALKIYKKISGEESINCASPLMNIGLVQFSQKNYEKALGYYRKTLQIQVKVKGQTSLDVSTTYINLALLVQQMGDDEKSLQYARKCYQIRKQILGEQHAKTKNAYSQVNFITLKLKKK